MSDVERTADGFVVDAAVLAAAFGLTASDIRTLMNDGRITSISEKGEGADEGRWRLTFYHGARALRLTVASDGTIVGRGTFPVPDRDARNRS